jgi:hypothetical protein
MNMLLPYGDHFDHPFFRLSQPWTRLCPVYAEAVILVTKSAYAKVWCYSSHILHNYLTAVDQVRPPFAGVQLALHAAWYCDLDGSVQVPCLECCCRCSCPCLVQ